MIEYKRSLLKGGSLAGTYLIESDCGKFVRKQISRSSEREYGFQRWYSQLKRLQRYEILFPELFCRVKRYGLENELAYFDLEFYEGAFNCQEYLMTCTDDKEIELIFNLIIDGMKMLHSVNIPSCKESISLYIEEEVSQKISDCLHDDEFLKFYNLDHITFKGEKIPSFRSMYRDYRSTSIDLYTAPIESYTHGNITLENILYLKDKKSVIFIDPYEENIIDNLYNEYSQILQSCNSHYEIYNNANINKDEIENVDIKVPYGIKKFDKLFKGFMKNNLSDQEIKIVRSFEISQFIRMLPFKMKVDKEKSFLFYCLASYLTNRFLENDE